MTDTRALVQLAIMMIQFVIDQKILGSDASLERLGEVELLEVTRLAHTSGEAGWTSPAETVQVLGQAKELLIYHEQSSVIYEPTYPPRDTECDTNRLSLQFAAERETTLGEFLGRLRQLLEEPGC